MVIHCVPRAVALPAWYGFLTLNMDRVLGTCVRGHPLSFPPAVHCLGLASLQRLGECVGRCDRHMLRTAMPISAVHQVVFRFLVALRACLIGRPELNATS
eukprot:4995590-Prymnesium_polylepis.2